MVKRPQGGFTLIEITIAMAITISMAMIAFAGLAGIRATAQFRSSVDDLSSYLGSVRTNAATSLNETGGGNSLSQLVFGELVTITPGSSSVSVQDMVGSNSSGGNLAAGADVDTITLGPTSSHTIQMGDTITSVVPGSGAPVTAAPYYIVFHRTLDGGNLVVYDAGNVALNQITNPSFYNESLDVSNPTGYAPIEPIVLNMKDDSGRVAQITIDGRSGEITSREQ